MEAAELRKKEATVLKLSICVFKLESKKGHLKWKVTELEAVSKISRSLIYRYLGSTKEEILKSSLQIFAFEFYGFRQTETPLVFHKRIEHTRKFLIQNHEVILFYQKWRTQDSWIQKEFITIEKKFQQLLKEIFPVLKTDEVVAIHAMIHGLVTAPFLTPTQAAASALSLEKAYSLQTG